MGIWKIPGRSHVKHGVGSSSRVRGSSPVVTGIGFLRGDGPRPAEPRAFGCGVGIGVCRLSRLFRRPGAAGLPSARWCLVGGGRSTTSYSPNPPNAFCDRLVRGRATGVCGGPSRSARRARLPTVLGEAAVQCLAKRMASRVIRSRWFWVSLAAAMSRIRRSTSSCNGRSIRDGSIRDSRRPGSTSADCRTRELFHTCIRGNNPK